VSTNFVVFRYGIFHAKPAASAGREEVPGTQYEVIPAQIDPRPAGVSQGRVKP
jgi:hypothetical protein